MKFTLKDYQTEAVRDALSNLKKGPQALARGRRQARLLADRRHRRGQDGDGGRRVRGAFPRRRRLRLRRRPRCGGDLVQRRPVA